MQVDCWRGRNSSFRFLVIAFCCCLYGCSINPTPVGYVDGVFKKDFSLAIVNSVRCELRDSFIRQAAKVIGLYPDFGDSLDISENIKYNPGNISEYKNWNIDPEAYVRSSIFMKASSGLKFNLNATETNDNGFTPTISSSAGPNKVTIGFSKGILNLSRKNERTIENIETRIENLSKVNCPNDENYKNKNLKINYEENSYNKSDWIYPIRGNIELEKLVNTYVDYTLNGVSNEQRALFSRESLLESLKSGASIMSPDLEYLRKTASLLSSKKCNVSEESCFAQKECYQGILDRASGLYVKKFNKYIFDGLPSKKISDQLTFTTTVQGGVQPSIEFSPVRPLKLKALAFGTDAKRVDEHKLLVVLSPAAIVQPQKQVTIGGEKGYAIKLVLPETASVVEKPIEACKSGRSKTQARAKTTGNLLSSSDDTSPEEAAQKRLDIQQTFQSREVDSIGQSLRDIQQLNLQ